MPNKNYIKGRRKEYKICKALKDAGFDIVQRTAGSHSEVDIIAISRKDKKILLVQAKPDNWTKKQIQDLECKNWWLNGDFNVEFSVE